MDASDLVDLSDLDLERQVGLYRADALHHAECGRYGLMRWALAVVGDMTREQLRRATEERDRRFWGEQLQLLGEGLAHCAPEDRR